MMVVCSSAGRVARCRRAVAERGPRPERGGCTIQLAKAELARRGISVTWSITQEEEPRQGTRRRPD